MSVIATRTWAQVSSYPGVNVTWTMTLINSPASVLVTASLETPVFPSARVSSSSLKASKDSSVKVLPIPFKSSFLLLALYKFKVALLTSIILAFFTHLYIASGWLLQYTLKSSIPDAFNWSTNFLTSEKSPIHSEMGASSKMIWDISPGLSTFLPLVFVLLR